MVFALWYGITRFGLIGAISVVVINNFLLRIILAVRFSRVLGVVWRDLLLLKDVAKLGIASAVAAFICVIVRSLLMANNHRPLLVLALCSAVFGAVYLVGVLLFGVPTRDEREKVRHGVERLQRFVYLRRSANFIS